MSKNDVFQQELVKLTEIFQDVEPNKMKLVEGLIEEAAFLKAENYVLRQEIKESGMVKIHPKLKDLQKPLETAKQYLKNINAYAVVIKALNSVLQKNTIEADDEFDDFMTGSRDE